MHPNDTDLQEWIANLQKLVGLETINHATQADLMKAITGEVSILVENEEKQTNYYREELQSVSDYYRRRIGYIAKLTGKPAHDPQERLAQVWRNCDEILRDRERSARLLTALEGEDE